MTGNTQQPGPVPWPQQPVYGPQPWPQGQPQPASIPSGWAWGVATSPLLVLLGAVVASGLGASLSAASWIGIAAMWVFALIGTVKDSRELEKAGVAKTGGFIWFCIIGTTWIYLLARALKTKTGMGWGIFVTGAILWLIAILAVPVITSAGSTGASCDDRSCVIPSVQQTFIGSAVKDGSVITGMACEQGTIKRNPGDTWTVSCTASYSDDSQWKGYATIIVSDDRVTFEPVSEFSDGS